MTSGLQPRRFKLGASFRHFLRSCDHRLRVRLHRRRMPVLIVEADPSQREAIVRAVAKEGFPVFQAASGAQASKLAARHRFEAVVFGFSETGQDILDFALRFDLERSQGVHQLVLVPVPRSVFLNRASSQIRYYGHRFEKPVSGREIAWTLCQALDAKAASRDIERVQAQEKTRLIEPANETKNRAD